MRVTVDDAEGEVTEFEGVAVAVVVTVTTATPPVVLALVDCPLGSPEADIVAVLGFPLADTVTPGVVVVVVVVVSVVPGSDAETTLSGRLGIFVESDGVAVAVVITVTIATPAVVLTSVDCPLVSPEAEPDPMLEPAVADGVTPGVIVVVFVVVNVVLGEIDETTLPGGLGILMDGSEVIEFNKLTVLSVVANAVPGSLDGWTETEGRVLELVTMLTNVVGLSAIVVLLEETGVGFESILASCVVSTAVAGAGGAGVLVVAIVIRALLMEFKMTLLSGAAEAASLVSLVLLVGCTIGGVIADELALALVSEDDGMTIGGMDDAVELVVEIIVMGDDMLVGVGGGDWVEDTVSAEAGLVKDGGSEAVAMAEAEVTTEDDTTAVEVLDVLDVVVGVDVATETDVADTVGRIAEAVV